MGLVAKRERYKADRGMQQSEINRKTPFQSIDDSETDLLTSNTPLHAPPLQSKFNALHARREQLKRHRRRSADKAANKNYSNKSEIISLSQSFHSKLSAINAIIARLMQFITFNKKPNRNASIKSLNTKHTDKVAPNEIERARCCKRKRNKSNRSRTPKCVNVKHVASADGGRCTERCWNGLDFIRQSLSLYAASGFLLMLCCLVIPAAAAAEALHPM